MSSHRQLDPRHAPLVVTLLLTFLSWVCLSRPAAAVVLDPRTIQSETMRNGLRLIVSNDPEARVVAVEIIVRVGAADDPPGQKGIAHLLEHLLWGGARDPEADPRLRIERIGGLIDAGTLRDYTRFYATAPAGNLRLAIETLGRMVLATEFDEDIIARERRIIIEESAARAEDPRAVLNDLGFAELYSPAHPYSSPIDGRPEDLARLDAPRLALFHQTWYVPNNMAVIVSGDAPFEAVRDIVARIFGDRAPAALPTRPRPLPPRPSEPHTRIAALPVEKAYVMAAFVGPAAAEHTSVCATDLLATLLAHGPLGRLVTALAEERDLAFDVGTDFLTQRDRALFGVWAICRPEAVEEVQTTISRELVRLVQEPVPPMELAAAKRLLAAGYAFANETPSDRATTLGFYEAIDSYRTASYYLSWVTHAKATALVEAATWYAGEPVWIILRPEAGR